MNNDVIYRIYNDSSHFVGTKYYKENEGGTSIRDYKSEYAKDNLIKAYHRGKSKEKADYEIRFDTLYKEHSDIRNRDKRNKLITEQLIQEGYDISLNAVELLSKKKSKSLYYRKDRFRKKAFNNKWNYFVTITYDDRKCSEENFKERLKRVLANFHDRYGYRYMGVFERSKNNRLHFHALMYIPKGKMRGDIKIVRDYSKEDNRMRAVSVNTFFLDRFGRNDFSPLFQRKEELSRMIEYIIKYINKSEERILYCRGIDTYIYCKVDDEDILLKVTENFHVIYIFFDDLLCCCRRIELKS